MPGLRVVMLVGLVLGAFGLLETSGAASARTGPAASARTGPAASARTGPAAQQAATVCPSGLGGTRDPSNPLALSTPPGSNPLAGAESR